jgi:hypothetical protein
VLSFPQTADLGAALLRYIIQIKLKKKPFFLELCAAMKYHPGVMVILSALTMLGGRPFARGFSPRVVLTTTSSTSTATTIRRRNFARKASRGSLTPFDDGHVRDSARVFI